MSAEIRFVDGNWVGFADGRKVVRSYDQTRVIKMMGRAGYHNVPIISADNPSQVAEDPQAQWPINQRFEFVEQLVGMVARGHAVSMIVTGPGGLGKTHTVRSSLEAAGLQDISGMDAYGKESTYRMIKGYSTAKGLYRELFQNCDGVLVFDDCDDVMKDATALNLLKGALDSYDRRIISWNADLKDEDLPRSFQFNGRVIFVSNMQRDRLDLALRTRSYCVDLTMTLDQKIERMAVLVASEDFLPRYSVKHKQDALAVIKEFGLRAREVSLRTLQAITRIRAAGGNWRSLAEYTLTN